MDKTTNKKSKRKFYQKKRFIFPVVIGLSFVILSVSGAFYSSIYKSTNNAYLDDYLIKVYPKISEKIIELNQENNSQVKKGEIIIELNGAEASKKVQELEENLITIQNEYNAFEKEINSIASKTSSTKAELENAKKNLENANDDYIRYKNSYKDGIVTKKDLNKAIDNLDIAQEQYEKMKNSLQLTKSTLKEISIKKNIKMEKIQQILEELENAKIELSNATITAPKNGKLIELNAKIGEISNVNKPIFQLIPEECYAIAKFKKLEKDSVKLNQNAIIKIYSHGFKKLNGEIVEIKRTDAKTTELKIKITDDIGKYRFKNNTRVRVSVKIN